MGNVLNKRNIQERLKGKIDELLQKSVEAGEIPGVVAMATNRNEVIYEGAFGWRVLGQNNPMTLDTVVWIASMTKALTTTAVMQLVEGKKLELDIPANIWVPELSNVKVLEGWDANGQPIMRAPKRPITLRHLLTHTSGFSYEFWNADIIRYQEVKGIPAIATCKNAALLTPLVSDPGDRWEYGIGIDWAGKVLEAVSGNRLGAYMQKNLFDPIGMKNTSFKLTEEMRSRLAKVHQRGKDGKLSITDFEIPSEIEFEMGGGGLYSIAGDYLNFVRMILNRGWANGNQVLKPETVDMMSRNAMGDLKVRMLRTVMPELSNDAEFFPGISKTWGLGFMINEETAPTGRSAGSLGWAGLANSYFWIDAQKGVGGVYLTQIFPFADSRSLPLFYSFEKEVYQALG